jgi:hypothetical protein
MLSLQTLTNRLALLISHNTSDLWLMLDYNLSALLQYIQNRLRIDSENQG